MRGATKWTWVRCTGLYIHRYIHKYMHKFMGKKVLRISGFIIAQADISIHTYMHAYIHTYIHTHTHTCMHTFTYIHMHTLMQIYIHTKRTYLHSCKIKVPRAHRICDTCSLFLTRFSNSVRMQACMVIFQTHTLLLAFVCMHVRMHACMHAWHACMVL